MDGCVSLCGRVMDWRPVHVYPASRPMAAGIGSSPPMTPGIENGWTDSSFILLLSVFCVNELLQHLIYQAFVIITGSSSTLKSMSMYLVGAPFASTTASMQRTMEAISLMRCNGSPACFSSPALLGLVSLIFLLTIPHRLSLRFRSGEFAGQSSSDTMVIEPCIGTFVSVGGYQVLLENEINVSIKLVSRGKHEVLQMFLLNGCTDVGLDNTQWINTRRLLGSPNHHCDITPTSGLSYALFYSC